MKTLNFAPELVPMILSGEKTSTWRLFDDKDLAVGDELELRNKETGEIFARARIMAVREKALREITESDYVGNQQFESREHMFKIHRTYYGDQVNRETLVKMIDFERI